MGHHPPRVGLHSLQNGREERSLAIDASPSLGAPSARINGLWWFRREIEEDKKKMPDIFKRGDIIVSATVLCSRRCLMVYIQDRISIIAPSFPDVVRFLARGLAVSRVCFFKLPFVAISDTDKSAKDLFAFQGTQTKQSKASTVPEVVSSWPSLPADPLVASIKPSSHERGLRPGEELDEKDTSSVNSLLTVTDDAGRIHCFLDGSYPLGAVSLGCRGEVTSLVKNGGSSDLLVHARLVVGDQPSQVLSTLAPLTVSLPMLYDRATRNVAEVSSAARELALYAIRVVKEMRRAWFGEEGQEGARALNIAYVRGVEERQRMQGRTSFTLYSTPLWPLFSV